MVAQAVKFISEEQSQLVRDRFAVSRAISTYLPIKLKGSGFTLSGFSGACEGCGTYYDSKMIRGEVALISPEVYRILGMVWCEPCKVITRCEYRLRDIDGRPVLQGIDHQGKWQSWLMEHKRSLISRLIGRAKLMFAGLTKKS